MENNKQGLLALTMYTDNREDWVSVMSPDTGKTMRVRASKKPDKHGSNQIILIFEANKEDYSIIRENAKNIKSLIKNNKSLVNSALSKGLDK